VSDSKITISFPDVEPDEANYLAEDLAKDVSQELRAAGHKAEPEIRRTDPTAQDFGTTLVLVLGAPAVIVLAKAVRDWAQRKDRSQISIDGVVIDNIESKDVKDIIAEIGKIQAQKKQNG
jgi:hypothetical protein